MDTARARHLMVETQVRTADVTDVALLAAMRAVPREVFAPGAAKSLAYSDLELDVGHGRYLLRPRELGKLIQEAHPRSGERVLEIAGGTGYGAAVLASIAGETHLLEPQQDLAFAARAALDKSGLGDKVKIVSTTIVDGWPDAAPYDVIVLNGAAEIVPDAWTQQLADGGRLAVIVRRGPVGEARVYTKAGGVVSYRAAFDAAPPVIQGLAAPARFVF